MTSAQNIIFCRSIGVTLDIELGVDDMAMDIEIDFMHNVIEDEIILR